MKHNDPCPTPSCNGRVYVQRQEPVVLVRVTGVAPLPRNPDSRARKIGRKAPSA